MLDVGLIIKLKLILSPFDIPPKIPPELFEEYPEEVISSLASDPLRLNSSSALPIDIVLLPHPNAALPITVSFCAPLPQTLVLYCLYHQIIE